MKTWNVLTGVVQLVEADTAEDAERIAWTRVSNAVDSFGDVYDLDHSFGHVPGYKAVFESEEQ